MEDLCLTHPVFDEDLPAMLRLPLPQQSRRTLPQSGSGDPKRSPQLLTPPVRRPHFQRCPPDGAVGSAVEAAVGAGGR